MTRFRQKGRTPATARRLLPWLSVAGLIFLSAGISAAPEEPEDGAGQQSPVSEEAEPATSDSEASSAEVFQPTEEISEDYAAPFPVDI